VSYFVLGFYHANTLSIQQFDTKGPPVLLPLNASLPQKGPKVDEHYRNNSEPVEPNLPTEHYPPTQIITGQAMETTETVAGTYSMDPSNKTLWGNLSAPYIFERPPGHPMEIASPLSEDVPCDPSLIVNVTVPSLEYSDSSLGYLPRRYGCSDENEIGREKASPAVSWSNVAFDVQEFSLQLVSMGDAFCPGYGPEAVKILWHITGIKAAPEVTLQEGASHDTRLLFGGKEQLNQWLEEYYSGPCPPAGVTQCFRFKILAHRANGWCQCGFRDFLYKRPLN